MYLDSQNAEILGWLIITLYITLPDIFVALKSPPITRFTSIIFTRYFGFFIGSLLLFYSRNYEIYAFLFLIYWIIRGCITFFAMFFKKPLLYFYSMFSADFYFIYIIILFGIFFQTEIWFITATLYLLLVFFRYIHGIFIVRKSSSKNQNYEYQSKIFMGQFLPASIIPFTAIIYIFNVGVLDETTLSTFYGTLITGFFTLLSIIAMFGVFLLNQIKYNRKYLIGLFKGLVVVYIVAILFLTIGFITLPENSEKEISLNLSLSTLIPDTPLNERELSNTEEIFGKIMFAASFCFLLSSLAHLYLIVSEMLKENNDLELFHKKRLN